MLTIPVFGRPGLHLYIGAATAESTADQPIKQTFRLLNFGMRNENTGQGVSGAIGIGRGGESHPVIEAAKEPVETSVSPEPTPEPQPEPTPEPTSEPVGACPEPVLVTAEEPYDDWEALHKAEFENEVYT